MKKLALVLATTLVSTPAMAGPYVNVETNANYTASNYESRSTDLHVGFEGDAGKLAYYVQGGRTINAVDGSDSESVTTGKIGGSVAATEKLGVYGEVSVSNLVNEDTDNTDGRKLGAKFSF